ncbi:ABC transporter permease [soil metagenome]
MSPAPWLSRVLRAGTHVLAAAVALFLLAPFVLSVLVSFQPGRSIELPTPASGYSLGWYSFVLADPLYREALLTSLLVGGLVAVVSVALALPLAATAGSPRWLRPLTVAVLLPTVVPPVVLGMQSLVASELVGLRDSIAAVVAVHTLYGLPLAFLVLRAAYQRLDPGLRDAARSLGAGPVRSAYEVTLPLLAPALVVAGLLAFVASLNELIMVLFVGGQVRTLPTVLWPQVQNTVQPDVAAASGLLLLTTLTASVAAYLLWRRSSRSAQAHRRVNSDTVVPSPSR